MRAGVGVVELLGALLLALEWWRSSNEQLELIEKKLLKLRHVTAEEEEPEPIHPSIPAMLSGLIQIAKESDLEPRHMIKFMSSALYGDTARRLVRKHRRLYALGFVIIVLGALLQIAANSIAWAGEKGFFGN